MPIPARDTSPLPDAHSTPFRARRAYYAEQNQRLYQMLSDDAGEGMSPDGEPAFSPFPPPPCKSCIEGFLHF